MSDEMIYWKLTFIKMFFVKLSFVLPLKENQNKEKIEICFFNLQLSFTCKNQLYYLQLSKIFKKEDYSYQINFQTVTYYAYDIMFNQKWVNRCTDVHLHKVDSNTTKLNYYVGFIKKNLSLNSRSLHWLFVFCFCRRMHVLSQYLH